MIYADTEVLSRRPEGKVVAIPPLLPSALSPHTSAISCHSPVPVASGPFASAKWLVPLIADVSLCCGLKEDASEDQLQLTATAILERYKWLKAGELMLFFFNFKAGFYERFYSYFAPQTIIRSMKFFLQERNYGHKRNSPLCVYSKSSVFSLIYYCIIYTYFLHQPSAPTNLPTSPATA